jgi:hypothetical protein
MSCTRLNTSTHMSCETIPSPSCEDKGHTIKGRHTAWHHVMCGGGVLRTSKEKLNARTRTAMKSTANRSPIWSSGCKLAAVIIEMKTQRMVMKRALTKKDCELRLIATCRSHLRHDERATNLRNAKRRISGKMPALERTCHILCSRRPPGAPR